MQTNQIFKNISRLAEAMLCCSVTEAHVDAGNLGELLVTLHAANIYKTQMHDWPVATDGGRALQWHSTDIPAAHFLLLRPNILDPNSGVLTK